MSKLSQNYLGTVGFIAFILALAAFVGSMIWLQQQNIFTCSSGYDYSWCNRYIGPTNMTIIEHQYDLNVLQYQLSNNVFICVLHHSDDNKYSVDDTINGYYLHENQNTCVTENYRNKFIKGRDYENRFAIFFGISIAGIVGMIILSVWLQHLINLIVLPFVYIFKENNRNCAIIFIAIYCYFNHRNYDDIIAAIEKYEKALPTVIFPERNSLNYLSRRNAQHFIVEENYENSRTVLFAPLTTELCTHCKQFIYSRQMIRLECGHWFHKDCSNSFINCPNCV